MATKKKLIALIAWEQAEPHEGKPGRVTAYKVRRVKNSIEYQPGQVISRNDVESLCNATLWDVHIEPAR